MENTKTKKGGLKKWFNGITFTVAVGFAILGHQFGGFIEKLPGFKPKAGLTVDADTAAKTGGGAIDTTTAKLVVDSAATSK